MLSGTRNGQIDTVRIQQEDGTILVDQNVLAGLVQKNIPLLLVALLVDTSAQEKEALDKTLSWINEALKKAGEDEMALSVSMGVAFSESGYTEELMRHADEALYYVKAHGRASHHFYEA